MVDEVWLWCAPFSSLQCNFSSPFFISFDLPCTQVVSGSGVPHSLVYSATSLLPFLYLSIFPALRWSVNLTAESGFMQIRNGSILIPCDGLYLVSLKSFIYLPKGEDWLKLTLQGTHKTISSTLWDQFVHSNDSRVNLTTVLYLFREDSITLWTDCNANISDLTFSLVLIADNDC
uniref:Uncharacterized protein n=1 Tax=Ficedula albicollis TaxID=59894 RepID=U3KJF7_FICAL